MDSKNYGEKATSGAATEKIGSKQKNVSEKGGRYNTKVKKHLFSIIK